MPDEPKAEAKPEPTIDDPIFEALWSRVLEAWDDDKTHNAILDHALRAERLADLAGRYRALEKDEAKGELAKKKVGAIVIAATQLLFSMKTPPRQKVPLPLTLVAAALCVGTLVWVARLILLHR